MTENKAKVWAYWIGKIDNAKRRSDLIEVLGEFKEETKKEWKHIQDFIILILGEYGLSPVESERIFESKKCFEQAMKGIIEDWMNEKSVKQIQELNDKLKSALAHIQKLLYKKQELKKKNEKYNDFFEETKRVCKLCKRKDKLENIRKAEQERIFNKIRDVMKDDYKGSWLETIEKEIKEKSK